MDVLGAIRLSSETDETTSPERQEAHIRVWAEFQAKKTQAEYNVTIVSDLDVSGAVEPFNRAGLGPYLQPPLLDSWQILSVAKLDRLTRSILHFETLYKWLEANDKTLVSIAEDINFSTATGRLMARQLITFAEVERETIKGRVKDAYDTLRNHGQYPGLQFPFGYIPVRLEPKGWGFKPHPIYGPVVADIADRLIAGESLGSLCRWLEAENIPTPRNMVREYANEARLRAGKPARPLTADARWKTTSLTKILRSEAIMGAAMADGKPLRDEQGLVIYRAESLIDRRKWERVKAILAANASRQGPRVNSSPLLQVAFCLFCKSPLYISTSSPGKTYRYYVCCKANRGECGARRLPADGLEKYVETVVLTDKGDAKVTVRDIIPASDNSSEMAEVAEAIGHIASQIALTRATGGDTAKLESAQAVNERNLAALANEPRKEARTIERETDETWAERWEAMDAKGRNAFLRDQGVRAEAARRADGRYFVKVWGPWLTPEEAGYEADPAL